MLTYGSSPLLAKSCLRACIAPKAIIKLKREIMQNRLQKYAIS